MEPRDEKRKVKVVYDVFITDPLRLEPQVFEYWLHGFTGTPMALTVRRSTSCTTPLIDGSARGCEAPRSELLLGPRGAARLSLSRHTGTGNTMSWR